MKGNMKKAPIRILIILLITGFISVYGEIVLANQLDKLQHIHENIMSESVTNREYMAEINMLLYKHQALLTNYALSDSADARAQYEEEELKLRGEITAVIIDFSYRMKGGEREQIYHRVYSDFSGYEENTSLYLNFIKDGDQDMAVYYNDNVLKGYLDDIDTKLQALDDMTADDIETAEKNMQDAVELSDMLRAVTLGIVLLGIVLGIYLCVKIVSHLEKYKEELEEELIEKNQALQEHNENMMKLQDGIIFGMANLIESRDGETGEHVKRTSAYVEMIAKAAREQGLYTEILTDEYIEKLVKAAPLHDVGKIAVPDQILMKPGKLTPEEFEYIKLHAPKGGEIIKEFFENVEDKEYVKMACDVAAHHHEKWSGEGYADHLAGEDIPLSARIMALADVFDALISKRCYKEAFSMDETFRIIEESSGTHFDPDLTRVFLSIRSEIEDYLKV